MKRLQGVLSSGSITMGERLKAWCLWHRVDGAKSQPIVTTRVVGMVSLGDDVKLVETENSLYLWVGGAS